MPPLHLERSPAAPAEPATREWTAPPEPDSELLTRVFHDLSTHGLHAAGEATLAETTGPMAPCPPRPAHAPLPPIPGYTVEELAGRGGMGVVYRATHQATGRTVALKLTNPVGSGDFITRERFVREVRSLATIKHPNVVPVYDAGDWHGFPFCTMEFVPGGTLNEHLDRIRADRDAAVRLLAKVARAVQALHDAGILHRDIKPLNILLGRDDEPMIADFGLARCAGATSDISFTGAPLGTRQYMAPEQTRGRNADYTPACDVWALGVTLYELLTGHRPFPDDGVADVYHCIRTHEPSPLAELCPGVPDALQAVVSKCLVKKPEDRYPSAAALADDLERYLRGEQPLASLSKPKRSRRRRIALAAAVVLAVAGVGAATLRGTDPKPKANTEKPTLAQRVAAGERVRLTDERGRPLVTPRSEPGHALHADEWLDHRCVGSVDRGFLSLSDEPLDLPYRVEADVAVEFRTTFAQVGVYVGRKEWPGLAFRHESLVYAGIRPERHPNRPAEWRLQHRVGTHWWTEHYGGTDSIADHDGITLWDQDGRRPDLRFARVVLDVRDAGVSATIDGRAVRPLTSTATLAEFNRDTTDRQRAGTFPGYDFRAPAFGPGVGLFAQHGRGVVRNLTVSKLDP